jgi:hypothetical protein
MFLRKIFLACFEKKEFESCFGRIPTWTLEGVAFFQRVLRLFG